MKIDPLKYIVEIATGVLLSISFAHIGEAGHGSNEYMFDRPNLGCSVEHPPEGSVISDQLTLERGHPVAIGNGDTYSYYSCWFNGAQTADLPMDTLMYGVSPYDAPDMSAHDSMGGESGTGPVTPIIIAPDPVEDPGNSE